MCRHSFQLLSTLASTWTIYASQHASLALSRHADPTPLRPISIVNYEAALGLQRRDSEDFSDLNLQTQSELMYGSPGDNGQLLLANMTLYAPDGLLMIMMERFEGLTSSVDCKGDDGTMSLTFNSETAFNHALQEWSYINENDDGQFLLIANLDGCGPADERQPYLISKITEDAATLTTYLAAQPAPWSDVAGTYDLDFGQAIPYQQPQRLKERGIWGDIVNFGKDVLDAATGSADLSKTVSFPVNMGQQGQRTNIYTDDQGRLTLDCINCFVTGSFEVTGHLSVQNFDLQDLTLTASPQSFQAELELQATIASTDEPDSLQYTKELFSAPVPGAGIAITGIFKLGATISYDVGVSSSFSGSATVDFGLQASLPNSAQLIADIQYPDASSATGFGGSSLNPIFDITKESASITLATFSQPKLAFGIELIEIGNLDVALTIKLPEISVTLTAAYDEAGACSQDAGASKTGVKLESEVEIEVDLQIDASLGSDEESAKPSWSQKLFGTSKPLMSQCFPLNIPGLDSNSNATTAPTSTGPIVGSTSSVASTTKAGLAASSSSSPAVPGADEKAAVVHPEPTTSSTSSPPHIPAATPPSTPVDTPPPVDSPPAKAVDKAPATTTKPAPVVPTNTLFSSTTISSAESGGGGCRMVKRFSKRMLIC